ncbi:hypothetical protein DID78_06040 [Candidatus Marinamargulisbacteria bacterium SCGC AG-343-D04]|nr:hypothetical protein DID78_06040 [Candidatus Marinamargulisbacteria bacterium SCGC AG-343-D04]
MNRYLLALFFLLTYFTVSSFAMGYEHLWSSLLDKYTIQNHHKGSLVTYLNYDELSKSQSFNSLLRIVSQTNPETMTDVQRRTFYINCYNIFVVKKLLESPKNYSLSYAFSIFNTPYTLSSLKKRIQKANPDYVYLLCDGSVSSPNLEAYLSSKLEAALSSAKMTFLKKSITIDNSVRIIRYSDWFNKVNINPNQVLGLLSDYNKGQDYSLIMVNMEDTQNVFKSKR